MARAGSPIYFPLESPPLCFLPFPSPTVPEALPDHYSPWPPLQFPHLAHWKSLEAQTLWQHLGLEPLQRWAFWASVQ